MSLLPQRKKSAEEIAELRGNLGVPSQQSSAETAAFADAAPLPTIASDAFDLKKVESTIEDFSFVPDLAVESKAEKPVGFVAPPAPVAAKHIVEESVPKPVEAQAPETEDTNAKIPSRKRSTGEIERLRRQIAFTQVEQIHDPRMQKAHPFLVALGYISVLIGASITWFYNLPIPVTAPFLGFSMLVALYVLIRKPISRHHAGFIFAICFLAIAFGILHYFPQLQHAA